MSSKFQNHATGLPTTAAVSCQVVTAEGSVQEWEMEIVCEKELEVSVNGIPAFRLTCTPQHLTELVLGRLRTERIIDTVDEVEHLFLCGEGNIAEVRLREDIEFRPYSGAEPTCCTGNRQLMERADSGSNYEPPKNGNSERRSDTTENGNSESRSDTTENGDSERRFGTPENAEAAPTHVTPVDPSPADVFALTEQFRADSALHRSTGGTHSCYIRFGDGRILSFEDIGRHNALDKAVGAMLLEGMDPADCMLYTTGRVAADMVTKAIGAGIPVMISKAVPTEEAVILANKNGLTLICRAWPDSYTRFC